MGAMTFEEYEKRKARLIKLILALKRKLRGLEEVYSHLHFACEDENDHQDR